MKPCLDDGLCLDSQQINVVVLNMTNGFIKNFNYLVVDEESRNAVIVDPAWEMSKIDNAIKTNDARLLSVLLTHSHADHIHLAKQVSDRYQCSIWMSQKEIDFSNFTDKRLRVLHQSPLILGNLNITPIFTPGHTPGGVCYLIGDSLFTGDTLFAEGCGMCDSNSDAEILYHSLASLKKLNQNVKIFPGHSYGKAPGQTLSSVMRDNIYLHFSRPEDFVAYRMRKGQSFHKMFDFK